MSTILKKPSFYGLFATGIIILLVIYQMYKSPSITLQEYLLLGILIGIHSILHYYMEISYKYNPLESGRLI